MERPTQEQIKEVWEWCGFTQRCSPEKDAYGRGIWNYPEGTYGDLELDLNNLFTYAIPKLERWEMGSQLNGMTYARVSTDTMSPKESENKDPALSLFWAIWQIYNQGG